LLTNMQAGAFEKVSIEKQVTRRIVAHLPELPIDGKPPGPKAESGDSTLRDLLIHDLMPHAQFTMDFPRADAPKPLYLIIPDVVQSRHRTTGAVNPSRTGG
jgi:hypothetical protein